MVFIFSLKNSLQNRYLHYFVNIVLTLVYVNTLWHVDFSIHWSYGGDEILDYVESIFEKCLLYLRMLFTSILEIASLIFPV